MLQQLSYSLKHKSSWHVQSWF